MARRALRLVSNDEQVDDAELVRGLRAGEAWAKALFFDRYSPLVERTLRRVLGHDRRAPLEDSIHDAFVEALGSLSSLRTPEALPGWLRSVAANVAFVTIRRRKARKWLRFWEPAALPELPASAASGEVREAYSRTYALLERLSAEHRVCFVLRYLEGLTLEELAEARGCSLSTVKRRLARAESTFLAGAKGDPVLREWIAEGGRWAK